MSISSLGLALIIRPDPDRARCARPRKKPSCLEESLSPQQGSSTRRRAPCKCTVVARSVAPK